MVTWDNLLGQMAVGYNFCSLAIGGREAVSFTTQFLCRTFTVWIVPVNALSQGS
jgi:hypothetical protein